MITPEDLLRTIDRMNDGQLCRLADRLGSAIRSRSPLQIMINIEGVGEEDKATLKSLGCQINRDRMAGDSCLLPADWEAAEIGGKMLAGPKDGTLCVTIYPDKSMAVKS